MDPRCGFCLDSDCRGFPGFTDPACPQHGTKRPHLPENYDSQGLPRDNKYCQKAAEVALSKLPTAPISVKNKKKAKINKKCPLCVFDIYINESPDGDGKARRTLVVRGSWMHFECFKKATSAVEEQMWDPSVKIKSTAVTR